MMALITCEQQRCRARLSFVVSSVSRKPVRSFTSHIPKREGQVSHDPGRVGGWRLVRRCVEQRQGKSGAKQTRAKDDDDKCRRTQASSQWHHRNGVLNGRSDSYLCGIATQRESCELQERLAFRPTFRQRTNRFNLVLQEYRIRCPTPPVRTSFPFVCAAVHRTLSAVELEEKRRRNSFIHHPQRRKAKTLDFGSNRVRGG